MADTVIRLPTLHADQVRLYRSMTRYTAVRCGRRYGKTTFAVTLAADDATKGRFTGMFAPDYKRLSEAYQELKDILEPVTVGRQAGRVIRTGTGGRVDFWTLDDITAGRSRAYHRVIIDEGAFTDDDTMLDIWERAIKPTLLDFQGSAIVLSNTNGNNPANFMWRICNEGRHGFNEYHAPSYRNPGIPKRRPDETEEAWRARRRQEFLDIKDGHPPLVYQQEYLSEFVDWSGTAFFERDRLLVDGRPVEAPYICEAVFAVVDTATKTGTDNDGTAVVYYAIVRNFQPNSIAGGATLPAPYSLVVLDWDIQQIEGALLETWLPTVFQNLEAFASSCRAIRGSVGAFIEDKSSGMVLLQQAARRGWPATPIDSKLTSVGKDERAISVSGYVYRGLVKLSRQAYERVSVFKGISRNHLLGQVCGFRVGDKDAAKRADDLLDCWCYGIAVALGNAEGF